MERFTYVEVTQNNTVLMRERNEYRLHRKLKELKLEPMMKRSGLRTTRCITNMRKPIGSIFEGTI